MSQLLIRRLDADVKNKLKRRAARHGQSMEAGARDFLRDAILREQEDDDTIGLGMLMQRRFDGLNLGDDELRFLPGQPARPAQFDE